MASASYLDMGCSSIGAIAGPAGPGTVSRLGWMPPGAAGRSWPIMGKVQRQLYGCNRTAPHRGVPGIQEFRCQR